MQHRFHSHREGDLAVYAFAIAGYHGNKRVLRYESSVPGTTIRRLFSRAVEVFVGGRTYRILRQIWSQEQIATVHRVLSKTPPMLAVLKLNGNERDWVKKVLGFTDRSSEVILIRLEIVQRLATMRSGQWARCRSPHQRADFTTATAAGIAIRFYVFGLFLHEIMHWAMGAVVAFNPTMDQNTPKTLSYGSLRNHRGTAEESGYWLEGQLLTGVFVGCQLDHTRTANSDTVSLQMGIPAGREIVAVALAREFDAVSRTEYFAICTP